MHIKISNRFSPSLCINMCFPLLQYFKVCTLGENESITFFNNGHTFVV